MTDWPMIPFHFAVEFFDETGDVPLCGGAFSEVSGIEATMEPKVIREGGNYNGEVQRAGQITYATVVLKRGMTAQDHLWRWFKLTGEAKTAARLRAELVQYQRRIVEGSEPVRFEQVEVLRWSMANALPVKFKAATYVAAGGEVGIEELHFVHEGLTFTPGAGG